MNSITFARPEYFYLLLLILPLVGWYIWQQKKSNASLKISTIGPFRKSHLTWKHYLRHLVFVAQMVVFSLVIAALAKPQSTSSWRNQTIEGIDIVIALDISGSMLARDFQPNRLEAAKNVASEFISGREYDRMGLVIFSAESFTQCPLTTDRAVLLNLFHNIESGMIEDGTAIGLGLANAVSRLKDSDAKSRVIILLTDGENNRGEIAPITAAEIAKTFGIRVYTIGIGSIGTAPFPVQTPFGIQMRDIEVKIDEKTLQTIANITDGKYFRATNNLKLAEIYKEIDKLEKSRIDSKELNSRTEEYKRYVVPALLLALIMLVLQLTYLKKLP